MSRRTTRFRRQYQFILDKIFILPLHAGRVTIGQQETIACRNSPKFHPIGTGAKGAVQMVCKKHIRKTGLLTCHLFQQGRPNDGRKFAANQILLLETCRKLSFISERPNIKKLNYKKIELFINLLSKICFLLIIKIRKILNADRSKKHSPI